MIMPTQEEGKEAYAAVMTTAVEEAFQKQIFRVKVRNVWVFLMKFSSIRIPKFCIRTRIASTRR
jgi:hypothetical protein